MTTTAKGAAQKFGNSTIVKNLARAGYAANGVLHVLIGILAVSVALGSGGSADQNGALATVAEQPFGVALLWLMGIGLAALALWGVAQAVLAAGGDAKDVWKERAKNGGKAVAYAVIAVTAFRYATGGGGGSSGDGGAQTISAQLLQTPFGVVLLLLVAAGIAGVGAYFVVKGAKRKFREDISVPQGKTGRGIEILGTVGYIAKGVALGIVGVLFAVAAVTADPQQAAGLDGALKTLAGAPLGIIALIAIGLGLVAYGVYCFARARYARI